jgi:hypothetical protein
MGLTMRERDAIVQELAPSGDFFHPLRRLPVVVMVQPTQG